MESEEEWRFSFLSHWGRMEVELIKIILGREVFAVSPFSEHKTVERCPSHHSFPEV